MSGSYNGGGNSGALPSGVLAPISWVTIGLFALGAYTASSFLSGFPIVISVPIGGLIGGVTGLYIAGANPNKLSGGGYVSQVVMAAGLAGVVVWFVGSVGMGVLAGAGFLALYSLL